jgi:hypothetical protein
MERTVSQSIKSKATNSLFERNELYNISGSIIKVALGVLEPGLELKNNALIYDQAIGRTWLSKLTKEMGREGSQSLVHRNLDKLSEMGVINSIKVYNQNTRKEHHYYVEQAFVPNLIRLYKATHNMNKMLLRI